jgi:hypothetical protein
LVSLVGDAQAIFGLSRTGGGLTCQSGFNACGSVVELTPPGKGQTAWTSTVIYQFEGGSDGYGPLGLAQAADGSLWGTTISGGGAPACGSTNGVNAGCGALFHLTLSNGVWSERVAHAFQGGTDGAFPEWRPSLDGAGNIYVSNNQGGLTTGAADASPTESCDGDGGWFRFSPAGLIVLPLWKAACKAGGPQFADSMISLIFSAPAVSDAAGATGSAANAAIITGSGGGNSELCPTLANNGCGEIALLTQPKNGSTPWTLTAIHLFSGGDGAFPYGSLLLDGSVLYGVTSTGGVANTNCANMVGPLGCGTIYSLTNASGSWAWVIEHKFETPSEGAGPEGHLTLSKGLIFGVTQAGGRFGGTCGTFGCGTIFTLAP